MSRKKSLNNTVVYQWLRKNGTPYYIGIGNPRRPYYDRRTCGAPPPRDRIVILYENLSWEEACKIEIELIAHYGRKDIGTGILRNMTDGGEGANGSCKPKYRENWYHVNYGVIKNKSGRELSDMFPDQKLCQSMLNKVRKGQRDHHKLWTLESTPEKSRLLHEERIEYNWYHKDHGYYCLSQAELARKFNMCPSHLPQVVSRKLDHFMGWTLADTPELSNYKNLRTSKITWIHHIYGVVICSQVELRKKFSEMNLSSSALSCVCSGKRNQHKGWRLLNPVMT
jgi:hypothetical protein